LRFLGGEEEEGEGGGREGEKKEVQGGNSFL